MLWIHKIVKMHDNGWVFVICEYADFKVFLPEISLSAVSALKLCFSCGDPQKPSAPAVIVKFAGFLLS